LGLAGLTDAAPWGRARAAAQALGSQLDVERSNAGNVAARPIETGDQTERDRIGSHLEDDRYGRGRRLCGARRDGPPRRENVARCWLRNHHPATYLSGGGGHTRTTA